MVSRAYHKKLAGYAPGDYFKNSLGYTPPTFSSYSVVVNKLGQLLNAGLEVNNLIVEDQLRVIEGKIGKKSN